MDYTYEIRLRRGTSTQWSLKNPILSDGEPGYATDLNMYKVGDGVTAWEDLPWTTGAKGDAATIAVGTTTTGLPGTGASVSNSGTSSDAVFDFVIPEGLQGEPGIAGPPGGSFISGWWQYSNSTSIPPGTGEIRTNPASVAVGETVSVYLNSIDDDGVSWSTPSGLVDVGDTLYLRDDAGGFWVCEVTSISRYSGWSTFNCILKSTTGTPPKKNARVQVSVSSPNSSYSLDNLLDVDVSTTPPTDQQALVYSQADSKWIPGAAVGGGSSGDLLVVSDLADIPPGTPAGTVIVLSAGAPVGGVPTVVSTSSIFEGTSFEVVLPAPATVADDDLLLAFICNQTPNEVEAGNGGEMSTIPAGFSRVAWPAYAADAGIRWQAVYAKIASSESGSYTFAWDTTYGRALGGMLVIRGANSVLDYNGPDTETDNIPLLPTVSVAADNTLAIGFVHNVHTAGNDGRTTFSGWDTALHVIGSDWDTASSNSISLVTRAYSNGQTAGGDLGVLNQGSMATDASATLIVGSV